MRILFLPVMTVFVVACNPFAPGFDDTPGEVQSLLGDQKTVDGVFQNIKYSYTFRDTTIYGQLLDGDFVFLFRDYDRGVDVTWGRDEEMRATHELFRNVQRLDLVWNNIIALSTDSAGTLSSVTRNFNLTVTFNPSDIIRVDGYANLSLVRPNSQHPWRIVRWKDESNF
ncbi:MAG TPA: hypothetical protein VNN76_10910 [Bacteroidota bacterium]|nr:hypothetical protein [Bacteroidota bacterium]